MFWQKMYKKWDGLIGYKPKRTPACYEGADRALSTTSHPKMQSLFLQVLTSSKRHVFSERKCQTAVKLGQLFALCHLLIPESDGVLQEESSEMQLKCYGNRFVLWISCRSDEKDCSLVNGTP